MQFADAQMNGEKAMVVKENIPILDLFRKSVDASREALTKVEVRLCEDRGKGTPLEILSQAAVYRL